MLKFIDQYRSLMVQMAHLRAKNAELEQQLALAISDRDFYYRRLEVHACERGDLFKSNTNLQQQVTEHRHTIETLTKKVESLESEKEQNIDLISGLSDNLNEATNEINALNWCLDGIQASRTSKQAEEGEFRISPNATVWDLVSETPPNGISCYTRAMGENMPEGLVIITATEPDLVAELVRIFEDF